MKRKNKKSLQSVVGLTVIDGQLRACHVTRAKGGLAVEKTASAPMTLDLLHPEAELVGREIKNHLDAAGIREKHCVVGIPPRWIMSQHTKVPEMSAEDAASFLEMEAEKAFPVDPSNLQIARSVQRSTAGEFVTQLAVRQEQIHQLSAALKAAGLKAVSYSLGLATLPGAIAPAGSGGRITVAVEPAGVTLLVSAGGGIAAFRTSEASIDTEAGEKIVNGASIARELRITFEQIPAELRSEVKELFLTGETTMVRQLAESLADWARAAGLTVTRGDLPEKNLDSEIAEKLAAHFLESGSDLEFLPPVPSRFAVMMARYSSKRLAAAGFGLAAVVLVVLGAFGWHEYKLWSLQSEWNAMKNEVAGFEVAEKRVREFSPWYDTSFRSLSILRRVTECFPDNGNITLKNFEMKGGGGKPTVTLSGTARDTAAVLAVHAQLRKVKEIESVDLPGYQGRAPLRFTITFRWNLISGK